MPEVCELTRRIVDRKARLLSLRQVTQELKVSVSSLNRWLMMGTFPKEDYRIGRARKWSSDTVDAWVLKQR